MGTDAGHEGLVVMGSGGWGTAIAVTVARKGTPVLLWGRKSDRPEQMARFRENKEFLPGVKFPEGLEVTADLEKACRRKAIAIAMAVPSHGLRQVAKEMRPWRAPGTIVISATKGFELPSGLRPSEVLTEALGVDRNELCILSGPSHAEEVGREQPTAVVAASENGETARRVQVLLFSPKFRIYTHSDPVGVELGGALKNIIAIACGISDGVGFGDNTRAALITRGLAEMARLGTALGGSPGTFMGLAGVGDLVVTCSSDLSRNRALGIRIGRGEKLPDILARSSQVAEGVHACKAADELGKKTGVTMPITRQVCAVLHEGRSPMDALEEK